MTVIPNAQIKAFTKSGRDFKRSDTTENIEKHNPPAITIDQWVLPRHKSSKRAYPIPPIEKKSAYFLNTYTKNHPW
jgi:hypothetical protein